VLGDPTRRHHREDLLGSLPAIATGRMVVVATGAIEHQCSSTSLLAI
jgi:hypothetical protein